MIVSDIPGTTRDAIDTRLPWGRTEIVLIDTAGIRRRGRVAGGADADRFSTLRSFRAISRADVAVLLIDAVDGLTAQDMHIAGFVVDEGRGLVVAVNKWDAVEEKTGTTFDQYVEWIRHEAPFLDFAPIVSISAKTGLRVARVLELAVDVWAERRRRISTGELNRIVGDATARQEPARGQGQARQDLLRHAGRGRATDVRVLRPRRGLGALQLPALPREPAARRVRLPRHADPARLPRAGHDARCRERARRPGKGGRQKAPGHASGGRTGLRAAARPSRPAEPGSPPGTPRMTVTADRRSGRPRLASPSSAAARGARRSR